ncbi:MAG: hypothetical protein ACT4PQ_11705 [Betaproteobacteria bacterium]
MAFRQITEGLSGLVRKARAGKLGIRPNHHGLENLERQIERASRRVALSLVTLGLYIAASLLMQHSIGPGSSISHCWPRWVTDWRYG